MDCSDKKLQVGRPTGGQGRAEGWEGAARVGMEGGWVCEGWSKAPMGCPRPERGRAYPVRALRGAAGDGDCAPPISCPSSACYIATHQHPSSSWCPENKAASLERTDLWRPSRLPPHWFQTSCSQCRRRQGYEFYLNLRWGPCSSHFTQKGTIWAKWIWSCETSMFWESKSTALVGGTARTQELPRGGPEPQLCREGLGHGCPLCSWDILRFTSCSWMDLENRGGGERGQSL